MPDERKREPWPWIIAGLLLSMMVVATSFAWVAHRMPDPVIVDEAYERSGGADGFHPRLERPGEADSGAGRS